MGASTRSEGGRAHCKTLKAVHKGLEGRVGRQAGCGGCRQSSSASTRHGSSSTPEVPCCLQTGTRPQSEARQQPRAQRRGRRRSRSTRLGAAQMDSRATAACAASCPPCSAKRSVATHGRRSGVESRAPAGLGSRGVAAASRAAQPRGADACGTATRGPARGSSSRPAHERTG